MYNYVDGTCVIGICISNVGKYYNSYRIDAKQLFIILILKQEIWTFTSLGSR